jgi:hypothetical protein
MKAQLSHKDWELISEYLDGELTAREKNRLDQRLNQQPELRNGLEELRQTRAILRSVPRRRAPRNFALTPEMVQKRALPRLFPVLSFSSALATVLVILTLFLQLLPGSQRALQAAPLRENFAVNKAVSQSATAAKSTPMIIQWGAQPNAPYAVGRGGGSGGGSSEGPSGGLAPQASNPSTLTDNQTAPTEAPSAAAKSLEATPETGAQPMAPALSAPAPAAPEAPATATEAQPPSAAAADQAKESNPILGLPPQKDEGKIIPQPEAESQPTLPVEPAKQPAPQINWWLIEAGLVIVALATGFWAIVLWRRARS